MMRQYELVERVIAYDPGADEALLNRAYVYAMKAHGHQTRASGDPYFSHPLEVAAILTDLKLDDATIATALLHDIIEDTETTRNELDELFGEEIGALVEGLTKIKKLDLVSVKAEQAENFRKLLIAITGDIRVLIVKFADRLHNMRTLQFVPADKRQRIAQETMDIYAPLAGRMGMQWLREELEDLAFLSLNPEAYKAVTERLHDLHQKNIGLIEEISSALTQNVKKSGLKATVSGREKKPYSIWNKMERKQISLEQLSDIYGFRVIVDSVEACYHVVGIIHTTWRMVPGHFKDYISNHKQNDYQSIHTTIIGPHHQRIELQIRTEYMHQVAEYGVAAHSVYKDAHEENHTNGKLPRSLTLSQESNAYQWLRHLVDMLLEGDNPEEFLEHTKLELFYDQVFCFTPKGRLIALPQGATPIDFAYAVHTVIGNSCVGCKINGRHVPLISTLKNGDEVDIVTSNAQTPPPAWESIARTGKARSAIRRATKEAIRRQYSALGQQILKRAFHRFEKDYDDEKIEEAVPRLSHKSLEDMVAALGRGELQSADVMQAIFPEIPREEKKGARRRRRRQTQRLGEGWFDLKKAMGLKFRFPGRNPKNKTIQDNVIPIRGHDSELPVQFAEGRAIPGDRIVGILTPGEGIKIYPIDSPKLQAFDDQTDRWIDVTWDIDEDSEQRFPVSIEITGINEPGTLAKIANIIGQASGNIENVKIVNQATDFSLMLIDLEVWDVTHLNEIIAGLNAVSVVNSVVRTYHQSASYKPIK